jgi:hypothetical protein
MPISRYVADEITELSRRQSRIGAADRDRGRPRDHDHLIRAQAEYDEAYRALGTGAPPPQRGEGEVAYRGRLASGLAPYTEAWRDSDLYALVPSPAVEAEVRGEVARAVADRRRGDLDDPRRMRKVETVENGITRVEWRGDDPRVWMNLFSTPFQIAKHIKQFDRRGVEAPPPIRWGHPPRSRT